MKSQSPCDKVAPFLHPVIDHITAFQIKPKHSPKDTFPKLQNKSD